MDDLRSFLSTKTQEEVLLHCLGQKSFFNAPALVHDLIVVAIDTEWWTRDPTKLTELGIATWDSRVMRGVSLGPYGENLMKNIWFYHHRNIPNTHLLNLRYAKGDPSSNRFGRTAFLTPKELNTALFDCFVGVNRPVVFMGHALDNDFAKINHTLGFNVYSTEKIVFTIDTQELARETGAWTHPYNEIGLKNLVENVAKFQYRDIHTACNDIAMTVISAIQLVLPKTTEATEKSMQDVVDEIESLSQDVGITWGAVQYCLRCGARDHFEEYCRASNIKCKHCVEAGRFRKAKTHRAQACISFALDELERIS